MTPTSRDDRLDISEAFLPADDTPWISLRNVTPVSDDDSIDSLRGLVLRFEEVEFDAVTKPDPKRPETGDEESSED